jgi:tRNA-(ms[2]io[6]A)-hydroxylase
MLSLKSATSPRWFEQVSGQIELLLIDHAHCEKKAAGTALNLIFAYVDKPEICRELPAIVTEELEHFQMVLDLLEVRGIRFRRINPSSYGRKLNELVSKQEPQKAIDRLLVAGLIEARSCERFGVLREQLADRELAAFYDNLFESEARHHSIYVRLAKLFGPDELVNRRLEELAAAEAAIVAEGDPFPRMHS